jgi:hypothetical protein
MYLNEVSSLKSPPSSSSDPALLTALLPTREFALEVPLEFAAEGCFDLAFLDMVLPLSRA